MNAACAPSLFAPKTMYADRSASGANRARAARARSAPGLIAVVQSLDDVRAVRRLSATTRARRRPCHAATTPPPRRPRRRGRRQISAAAMNAAGRRAAAGARTSSAVERHDDDPLRRASRARQRARARPIRDGRATGGRRRRAEDREQESRRPLPSSGMVEELVAITKMLRAIRPPDPPPALLGARVAHVVGERSPGTPRARRARREAPPRRDGAEDPRAPPYDGRRRGRSGRPTASEREQTERRRTGVTLIFKSITTDERRAGGDEVPREPEPAHQRGDREAAEHREAGSYQPAVSASG